ncbi:type IV pilin protein [Janibacter sp. RAF20_2_2]|uniref:type IV pilin protein n=1 Tax=unclassified Janibacter TaxID=2649294 RepID=UPI003F93D768
MTKPQSTINVGSIRGFTIVELLIVIVVIAILAAISVVAYNGVQDRARDSALRTDLNNAAKKFETFNAIHGRYPNTSAEWSGLGVKFSFSPVGSRALLCADASGYAIFAYHPDRPSERYRISPGGIVSANGIGWSSAPLCATTPYSSGAWGNNWVLGG